MIKIVLPFLLIGKALKPLAKIKKQAWKQMGTAFGSIQSAVDPMKSFAKIFEVISVIMLPLTFIMTLLASVILKKLMPYIEDLIDFIDDLGITAETTAENIWYMNGALDWAIYSYPILADHIIAGYNALVIWFDAWDERQSDFFIAWDEGLEDIYGWFEDLIADIMGLLPGGGGGGGDGDDDLPWYIPQHPLLRGSGSTSSSTSNTVNINLSNSVIDDRAALVRDIVEQVIIRIG